MIDKTVYGPMEYLAPDTDLQAILEISGIKCPDGTAISHVFLDEVQGDRIADLIQSANYAGSFTVPEDLSEDRTVQIDVTNALRKAEQLRPNFHITFLTEYADTSTESPALKFDEMHIIHEPPLHIDLDISADVVGGLRTDQRRPRKHAD